MAEDKKSFICYSDHVSIFKKLLAKDKIDGTNNAGELAVMMYEYVNDLNPEPVNFIVEMAFEPIKLQLKRDLCHWNNIKEIRSESGKLGGLKSGEARRKKKEIEANEANASKTNQKQANEAVNVNDTVNVNDNEKTNNEIPEFLAEDTEIGNKKRMMYDKLINNQQWHDEIFGNWNIEYPAIKREIDKFVRKKFAGISVMEHISEYKRHFVNHLEKVSQIRPLTPKEREKKLQLND
jgi:hypothetical protein